MRIARRLCIWLLTFLSLTAAAENRSISKHEQGRKIYNFRCYYCHGYSGDAKTLASTFLTSQPRDFTKSALTELSRERMIYSVTHGVPNSAMKPFGAVISATDIELVVDFVRTEFMQNRAVNTLYHTEENGWPDHDRYAIAAPFATGQIKLDAPESELSESEIAGKALYLSSCISCHDRSHVSDPGKLWDPRPLSFPRDHYSHRSAPIDVETSASIYAAHDRLPQLDNLTPAETRGQQLFQQNCAFCHGADGTGMNWIGSFLEPHPRNLSDPVFMKRMTRSRLKTSIKEGLPGTSMPTWKHLLNDSQIEDIVSYINRAFHPVSD